MNQELNESMTQAINASTAQAISTLVAQAPETSPMSQAKAPAITPVQSTEPSVHQALGHPVSRRGRVARAKGKTEPRRVAVYFPPELGDALAVWCTQNHRNMSETIVDVVRQWFEHLEH